MAENTPVGEPYGGQDPHRAPLRGLAERHTLRHWPWLVMCLLGASVFGLLTFAAAVAWTHTTSPVGLFFAAVLTLGLGVLAVYSLASLRTRTVLDRSGGTALGAFSRRTFAWSGVERLDVTHALPGWTIRAWTSESDTVTIFICHDTHGRRPKAAGTYERPPAEAPTALHRGFPVIQRYWQASGTAR